MDSSFIGMFQIAIGVYLLYGGITGKGQMYNDENIKSEMKEKYRKTVRISCNILGLLIVLTGVLDMLHFNVAEDMQPMLNIASYITWGITMAGIITLFILVYRMGDRTKKNRRPGEAPAPRAAFEFDEEEKKDNKSGK